MTGCTTCPFPEGYLPYAPSTAGNAFLLAAFAALVPVSLFLGYRHPALGFTLNFVAALCLEVLGFAGRLLLGADRKSETFFALYLLGSVLGTTAFASAILVVLPHLLGLYGASARRGARVAVGSGVLLVMIGVLEVVGIAFAVFGIRGAANTRVLVAGLAIQVLALVLFVAIHSWVAPGLRSKAHVDPQRETVHQSPKFKRFLLVLHLSILLLLATTAYRIAEITPTLSSAASANEPATTTVHGGLPLLFALLLTVFHPGLAFGRSWSETEPRYTSRKAAPAAPAANPYRAPGTQYSIRRVAPARLSHISGGSVPYTPYELYPSPVAGSPGYSPGNSPKYSPGYSPKYSPGYSPGYSSRKSPHTASQAHSPRKIPETTLVDDDALW
ncbi:hypothetical protein VUR80DRAFT_550 [Thermomyces stellatus]